MRWRQIEDFPAKKLLDTYGKPLYTEGIMTGIEFSKIRKAGRVHQGQLALEAGISQKKLSQLEHVADPLPAPLMHELMTCLQRVFDRQNAAYAEAYAAAHV